MKAAALVVCALAACSDGGGAPPPDATETNAIIPGTRVGPITLGMTWTQVVAAVGAPPTEPVVLVRVGYATWPALGLEALLTSPADTTLADDALVIGAAATAGTDLGGAARPGLTQVAIEAALGPAPEVYGGRAYYPAGVAVEYDAGGLATRVAVFAPYTLAPEPPPMAPARTFMKALP